MQVCGTCRLLPVAAKPGEELVPADVPEPPRAGVDGGGMLAKQM